MADAVFWRDVFFQLGSAERRQLYRHKELCQTDGRQAVVDKSCEHPLLYRIECSADYPARARNVGACRSLGKTLHVFIQAF